jgi:protein O-GlcNAc transferase
MNNIISMLNRKTSDTDKEQSDLLFSKIHSIDDHNIRKNVLRNIVTLNPNNSVALLHLASLEFNNNITLAFILLERAFGTDVSPKIYLTDYRYVFLMGLLARYKIEIKDYKSAIHYLNRLVEVKQSYPVIAHEIQLATLITEYPDSLEHTKKILMNAETSIDNLLELDKIDISYIKDQDPYIFCMLTFFNLEIYHECDIKSLMSKYYKLMIKVFPSLIYTSPYLKKSNTMKLNKNKNKEYHIGIISAFFGDNTSVLLDFKGVINMLPDKYKFTFIYINETNSPSDYLKTKKNVREYIKSDNWLEKARDEIGSLELDMLYYLDSTMSTMIQRLIVSKLAKIQIVSHGHPITSGVDRQIVNYYISWAGAELEYEKAQKHYTEKLILIPKTTIHQYYYPITNNFTSLIDNKPFNNINRIDFNEYIPSNGNWYLCMQKPFKRHPEFDYMLKSILEKDPQSRILLHGDSQPHIHKIMLDRFKHINADTTRVHFIPVQPHYRLMALYILSDVILDSYYAGGCTTTREALEVGCSIVTLPTNYLGGRWTYGYYNIIGITDMIATTKEDYVNKAVRLGTDKEYNQEMKEKILKNTHKLFYQQSAVDAWDNIFMNILNKIE